MRLSGTAAMTALAVALTLPVLTGAAAAETISANSIAALEKAVSQARPGDVVELAPGQYDENCTLSASGAAVAPITIRSQALGAADLRGAVSISANHMTFTGFRLSGKGTVRIKGHGIRMSHCSMMNVRGGIWVRVEAGSRNVEIDHCRFEDKEENSRRKSGCQLLQLKVLNKDERHHIHHNHFLNIPKGGSGNGFETVQVITQGNARDPAGGACNTLIEDNLFEACNGEAEIISIKANGNMIRRNTFRACRGALVLRHGDANVVLGNIFLGGGEGKSGGVRLQGMDQIVVNNLFHSLGSSGVAMMDGTPDKLYVRVERASIVHNTFINCRYALDVGLNHSLHPNGTVPRQCLIANNIFFLGVVRGSEPNEAAQAVRLVQDDQPEEWRWIDNVVWGKLGTPPTDGIRSQDPGMTFLENGLVIPTTKTPSDKASAGMVKGADVDLFGTPRAGQRTIGAVQFPTQSVLPGPLVPEQVGPQGADQHRE